jgi:hypothetical protein
MIRIYTFVCILALATFANAEDLQTVVRGAPEDHERDDPERGIHVSIARFEDDTPNSSSGSSRSSTEIVEGAKYSVSVITRDTSKKTFRIRLTEPTLRYLISSRDEHVFLRFLAIRDLPDSDLDIEVKKELMDIAIKEPNALVRSIAARAIPRIKPQDDVADLLIELLNDPCMDVVSWVISPLVKQYDLREESGDKLKVLDDDGFSKGPPSWFYYRHQQDALRVALALRHKNEDLIAPDVIAQIRQRRVPSDEWFLDRGGLQTDLVEARSRFLERYHKPAEQAGAGQPATRSESDSEGGDKAQTESKGRSR